MFQSVRVILIKTSHPGNIGAVARAMKNMGFAELFLVEPKIFPSEDAFQRSSGAASILDNATVVSSLDEALVGCQLVVGASARNRKITWPVFNPRDCAQKVAEVSLKNRKSGKTALLFGRENNGLSNAELQRCNYHVHIPSDPEFSSLNLAMAVQVILYELRMYDLIEKESSIKVIEPVLSAGHKEWDQPVAEVLEVNRMLAHMEAAMIATGFHDPQHPKQLISRLRRLFQRVHLDKMEVNILRGFWASIIKKSDKSCNNTGPAQIK